MRLYIAQVYYRHGGCCEGPSQIGIFSTPTKAQAATDAVVERTRGKYMAADMDTYELDEYDVTHFVARDEWTDEERERREAK